MLVESGEDIQARKFESVSVRLSPKRLLIGNASYGPGQVKRVEIVTDHITLPREAVGLGLVKLSGLIGAFLGWPGSVFAIVSGGIAIVVCQAMLSTMKPTEPRRGLCDSDVCRLCGLDRRGASMVVCGELRHWRGGSRL